MAMADEFRISSFILRVKPWAVEYSGEMNFAVQ